MSVVEDALLGTAVGPYRLEKLLGRGGMGRVYLGVQPEIGGRVAIKVLADDACGDPELVDRFFTEARSVNLINHDGIVRIFDLVKLAGGRPAIVMELIEGRTLREVIEAGRTPIGGVVQMMFEVLSALAAAHAIGIVHRDLKPDNLIVSESGRTKILDFGIAKLMLGTAGSLRKTRTGAVIGTPQYMSPEQIQGREIDPRSDLYSLGVVLYEAVTGRRPFDGDSDFELMVAHVDAVPPPLGPLRPDLPQRIADVILCALAKRPVDRFRSAQAMANAMHAASEDLPAHQWRSLSTQAAVLYRPSQPPAAMPTAGGASSQSAALTRQQPPPARDAQATRAERVAPRGEPPTRAERPAPSGAVPLGAVRSASRIKLAIGVLATAAVSITVTAIVVGRSPAPATAPAPWASSGGGPLPQVAIRSLDYDPAAFDAIAYLPKARAQARTLIPDAELTTMMVTGVDRAGRANITSNEIASFVFASESRAKPCFITVVTISGETVGVSKGDGPCQPTIKPRCTIAEIWTRAIARGANASEPGTVMLMLLASGPLWRLQVGALDLELEDDCVAK